MGTLEENDGIGLDFLWLPTASPAVFCFRVIDDFIF